MNSEYNTVIIKQPITPHYINNLANVCIQNLTLSFQGDFFYYDNMWLTFWASPYMIKMKCSQ